MNYIKEMIMHNLQGSTLRNWFRILFEIKYKIQFKNIPKALYITFIIFIFTPFRLFETLMYKKKVMKTEIKNDPVFILGHWRSGTTYLNNLMSQDKHFGFFNMIQSVVPSMLISGEKLLKGIFKIVMPRKRPMDAVKIDIDSPQEEEYAIGNLIPYSFTHITAFPQQRDRLIKYLTFNNTSEKVKKEWKQTFEFILKKLTYAIGSDKQLLIKNPINSCRIKMILEIFPNAKFIHIYRDPYNVYKSTRKMYESLFNIFRLEKPLGEEKGIEFQLKVYEELFKKYFEEKDLIPKENLVEIKYEEFVKAPMEHIQNIYSQLELKGFEDSEIAFRNYINDLGEYTVTNHDFDYKKKKSIYERFAFVVQTLKYNK